MLNYTFVNFAVYILYTIHNTEIHAHVSLKVKKHVGIKKSIGLIKKPTFI